MPGEDTLGRLREAMRAAELDALLVPRSDEHLGENVPASAERLAYVTGFTGSAGVALVLPDRAAVFSDGRYVLQLAAETDGALWERLHLSEAPPPDWLRARAAEAGRVLRLGYDPRVMAEAEIRKFAVAGVELVAVERNPVDAIWHDRPAPPAAVVRAHEERFSGRASAEKRAEIAAGLRAEGVDAALLTDPASIGWLLNIRGGDLPTVPVALAFALLRADGHVALFIEPGKLDGAALAWLGNDVSASPPDAMAAMLDGLGGKRVRVDPQNSPAWFAQRLRAAGATVVDGADVCLEPKARKNEAEREGMRRAHLRDGVAVCRFLHWVRGAAERGETELSASARLRRFRSESPAYLGDSFEAISGAGEHGAVMHYRVTAATDRAIGSSELYLIDSGGQYEDGTTDVTRTVWTGGADVPTAWRSQFTRVLKGMIALCTARFPEGVTGHRLDALARHALWQVGLDYDHGTGHGVGSVLSVHEGPVNISAVHRPAAVAEGMVVSDEPGYYQPGSHGIRIENMLLVERAALPDAVKPFLQFETLTLAPIDRACIEVELLDAVERDWLDAYHRRVADEIGPLVEGEVAAWLRDACAPV